MKAMEQLDQTLPERKKLYLDGTEVEVWENPDAHFGATPADLKAYFAEGRWIALFNAMMFAARPDSHV